MKCEDEAFAVMCLLIVKALIMHALCSSCRWTLFKHTERQFSYLSCKF